MTDFSAPDHTASGSQPQLRCPACTQMATLPAEMCPHCRANLCHGPTTGSLYGHELEPGRRRRLQMILGAVVLVAIISVAWLILKAPDSNQSRNLTPSNPSQTGLEEILDNLDESPRNLNPAHF